MFLNEINSPQIMKQATHGSFRNLRSFVSLQNIPLEERYSWQIWKPFVHKFTKTVFTLVVFVHSVMRLIVLVQIIM